MLLLCSGCIFAEPCSSASMRVDEVRVVNPSLVKNKVRNVGVSGGRETNPLLTSDVGNEEFRVALIDSLLAAGIYHGQAGNYELSATITDIDQPLFGFTFTVRVKVNYLLRNLKTHTVLFERVISSEGSASPGDEFIGVHRLRVAKERAMKNNIKALFHFIDFEYGRSRKSPQSVKKKNPHVE